MRIRAYFLIFLIASCGVALAQKRMPEQQVPKNGPRATLVRDANLYVQPNEQAQRVSVIMPGREMVIVERSGDWVRVFANIDALAATSRTRARRRWGAARRWSRCRAGY